VYLLQADGRTLKAIAAQGKDAQAVKDDVTHLGTGIIGSIVQKGVAERIDDTTRDARKLHVLGTEETPEGEKLIVAPLLVQGKAIGALAIWRNPQDPMRPWSSTGKAGLSPGTGLSRR
jgi:transcriptional regulator with GAF, ATPase, and Fis domain